jgi:hypothetical protein
MTVYRGMNVKELMDFDGLSQEQAIHEMNERVFGVGYKVDKHGVPIETGIGSAANSTANSRAAAERARARASGT